MVVREFLWRHFQRRFGPRVVADLARNLRGVVAVTDDHVASRQSVGTNGDMDGIFWGMRVVDGVGEDERNIGSVDLGGLCFVAVAGGDGAGLAGVRGGGANRWSATS